MDSNEVLLQPSTQPHVLLVDDDPTQLKLSAIHLTDAGFSVSTARGAQEALKRLDEITPNAILSDVLMDEIDGFGLCRRFREREELKQIPIILLSAHYGDSGAHDLARRVGAFRLVTRTPDFQSELHALNEALGGDAPSLLSRRSPDVYEEHLRTNANQITKLLGAARLAEGRYRTLFENANDMVVVLSRGGIIIEANERWRDVLGLLPHELVGKALLDLTPRDRDHTIPELRDVVERGSGRVHGVPMQRPDGGIVYLDFSVSMVPLEPEPLVLAIARDITGRFLAAQALAAAEEKYRSLVERMPDVVWTISQGRCVFITANIEQLTGFTANEIYTTSGNFWQERVHPDDEQGFLELYRNFGPDAPKGRFDLEYRWRHRSGNWVWLWTRITARYERNGIRFADGLTSDISQRRQLEESLRQAQKMEAIGQLTGGIAHDFNNILATILANSQFLLDAFAPNDPRAADAEEIKTAAERAANLTRQLLVFSRKQVLELRSTDLNAVIGSLERMLRRLIGEDVELDVRFGQALGKVQADAGQIEQVVLNLVLNARDAMPRGGRISIETDNVELGDEYRTTHASGAPGSYVVITVSDTGVGMDAATQRHLFEPFFTTKEQGRGTGLGLAICHGIVAQSGGHINVYSEVGRGSVFKVYLPQLIGDAPASVAVRAEEAPGGNETVLLVEDNSQLRAAIQRMLHAKGYKVIVARDGIEALQLAKVRGTDISLLVTDIVMPKLGGPELATMVRESIPQIAVLFMSGYTDHAMMKSGSIQSGIHFLQKPFSIQALAVKVREALAN